jgi:outer membrane protein OmpA-like peptidoglycan-associated protein
MYSDDDDSQERIVLPLVIGVAMFVIVGVLGLVSFNKKPATAAAKPAAAHAAAPAVTAAAPAVTAPAAVLNLKDDESQVVVENGVVKFYFASGKAEVAKGANEALADVVKGIKAGQKATISGFHDTTGNAALNAELSKKRAFAVRDALLALGVTEDKLELVKPADSQGSGAAAEARRVEVTLVK